MFIGQVVRCKTFEEALEVWCMYYSGYAPFGHRYASFEYFTEEKFDKFDDPLRGGFAFVIRENKIANFGVYTAFKKNCEDGYYEIVETSDLLGTSEVFSEDFSIEDLLGGDL